MTTLSDEVIKERQEIGTGDNGDDQEEEDVSSDNVVLSNGQEVSFSWNTIQGSGIVDHSDVCHGNTVKDDNVRLRLTLIHSEESYHPISRTLMEVGRWTFVLHFATFVLHFGLFTRQH